MINFFQVTGIIPQSRFAWTRMGSELIPGIVGNLLALSITLVGMFFFVRLIQSGFSLMTSGGDSAKVESAKSSLTNAFIGLIVVLTTFFIAQIIQAVTGLRFLSP